MNNYFIIKFFMGLKLNYSTLLICSKKKDRLFFIRFQKEILYYYRFLIKKPKPKFNK